MNTVRVKSDLKIETQSVEGVKYYILKEPAGGKFIRLREPEYYLLTRIDGNHSLSAITADFIRTYNLQIAENDVASFIKQISKLGFIEGTEPVSESGKGSIFFIKLKAFNPDKLLNKLYPKIKWLFTQPAVILQLLVILTGSTIYFANLSGFPFNLREIFTAVNVATIIIAFFLLVTFHEFAHALACVRYGGRVREMGFLLLYFQPCFYCNLSDAYLFKERRQRLIVNVAGLYFQMVVWSLFAIMWRLTVEGYFLNEIFRITATVCFITLLFNLNPAIKLDGYYILADYLQIPNLRQKAFSYLWAQVKCRFFGCPVKLKIVPSDREAKIYIRYSLFSLCYSILLVGFLLFQLGQLLIGAWGGIGFILFLTLSFLIFKKSGGKLVTEIVGIWQIRRQVWMKPKRIIIYTLLLVIIITLGFIIRVDQTTGGPACLRAAESYILKRVGPNLIEATYTRGGTDAEHRSNLFQLSSTDFSVTQVVPYVALGDTVIRGDTLLVINSALSEGLLAEATSELKKVEAERRLLLSDPKLEEIAKKRSEVKQAEARYDAAKSEYNRVKELYEKSLISENEFEKSAAEFNVASSALETKKNELKLLRSGPKAEEIERADAEAEKLKTRTEYLQNQIDASVIRSPIDGILIGTTDQRDIFHLAHLESLLVEIELPGSDLDILSPGQAIELRLAAYPSLPYQGKVIKLRLSSGLTAVAAIENRNMLLFPQMGGYAKVYCGRISLGNLILRKISRFFRLEFWSWF